MKDLNPGDLPFELLVTGRWRPGHVRATWVEDSRPRFDEVELVIEQAWSAANVQKDKKLFDGPMCRLEQWRVSDDLGERIFPSPRYAGGRVRVGGSPEFHGSSPPPQPSPAEYREGGSSARPTLSRINEGNATPGMLELDLSPTSYRIFFGTNLSNPGLADRFGKSALANATGLSACLMTSDGFLMLGRRNSSVAYYPGRVHPFAGSLEPNDAGDVFAAMQRELAEELSIKPGEIQDMHCAAIAEDRSIRHPELIFPIFLSLTREQVEARLDAAEHETCRAIPLRAADLQSAIADRELTPIATATVWLVSKLLDAHKER